MKNAHDIVGTTIGIYNVLYLCDKKTNDGHRMYHVQCTCCGWETDMRKTNIEATTQCVHRNKNGSYRTFNSYVWQNKKLGHIFRGMKRRCYCPNNKDYRWYGAKGIKICDEWIDNPKLFEDWALANGYEEHLTIDRMDENKDYCPSNCHWVEGVINSKYKSTTSLIEVDGEIHTGREWSQTLGFGINTINTYIRIHGEENTKEFIRRYLKNPSLKPKNRQSYYDLYMNNNDSDMDVA